jgi:hypothetical protein
VNETYTKEQLVTLATTHHSQGVREAAAELLYTRGVKDGGLQMVAVTQRALAQPANNTQVPS